LDQTVLLLLVQSSVLGRSIESQQSLTRNENHKASKAFLMGTENWLQASLPVLVRLAVHPFWL
jgi:hypothetical protein